MENKCLCNCTCKNPWKTLKVYDHIKEVDEHIRRMEFVINEMKEYSDAPWYSRRPFQLGRDHIKRMLEHIKIIRDKYAKDLGMTDDVK